MADIKEILKRIFPLFVKYDVSVFMEIKQLKYERLT